MELNLFGKKELWLYGIALHKVNLNALASTVAGVLRLPPEKVLVVDAGGDHVTFDLLCDSIQVEQLLGREQELLSALASVPGITLNEKARIHAEGVLGFISCEKEAGSKALCRSSKMYEELAERLKKRAIVFSTGNEVAAGLIEDTNSPWLTEAFRSKGYSVSAGRVLPDDREAIAGALRRAAVEGFGLAVTTGGVGAESEDCTVEALLTVDPEAETRYLVYFKVGTGRHVKPGVRMGVGRIEHMLIITLPGPHNEVCTLAPVLLMGIEKGMDCAALADALAEKWRACFVSRQQGHQAYHFE